MAVNNKCFHLLFLFYSSIYEYFVQDWKNKIFLVQKITLLV
ncbi:MAG: hypothetical protein BWY27_00215 [Bacteroidetes bacterium ADurb.Bin234]|nr:MAG: hypothetical protein BWY27_00215 [Bacteroidetes bacterium ADurb.Bin234]